MASFSKAHRSGGSRLPILRPQAFRRHDVEVHRVQGETRQLWDEWLSEPSEASFNRLLTFYLPLTQIEACKMAKHRPDLYTDIDEMISDAVLGLMRAIHRRKRLTTGMMRFIRMDIRDAIRRHMAKRRWGGETRWLNQKVIGEVRRKLTQQLGRLPTDEEMLERLRGKIFTPNIYIGDHDARCISQLQGREDKREIRSATDDAEPPIEQAIHRELKSIMLKSFKGDDRKMFEMLMRGCSMRDVARAFSISDTTARTVLKAHEDGTVDVDVTEPAMVIDGKDIPAKLFRMTFSPFDPFGFRPDSWHFPEEESAGVEAGAAAQG